MSLDRLTPTRRPQARVVQRQRWLQLLFLHWKVPAEVLRPLIPEALSIDTFDGHAYVGLVPFTMRDVRPVWAPAVPGISHFHETNVRTYVHHQGQNPGVWFFSLEAANALAVWIARTFWHLPYHHARMSIERLTPGSPGTSTRPGMICYHSERLHAQGPGNCLDDKPHQRPGVCHVHYRPEGEPQAATPGTLEHFLAERYILYAATAQGLCMGRVHHAPYPLQGATLERCDETLLAAAGIPRGSETPLAHYAAGVDVEVFGLEPLAKQAR